MKTALIIGASGLIGSELTQLLLADERYSKINVLVRTPLEINDDKLNQIRYNFDWPEAKLVQGDELFCCLGTTIKKAGSQDAFRKVDYDYINQTAKLSLEIGIKKMAMISSIGANINSKVFYSRVKGEIEAAISALEFESCHILRPSLLLGNRSELRIGEIVGAFFSTAFSFAIPDKYQAIEASQVAKGMIACMNSEETGLHILESDDIMSK